MSAIVDDFRPVSKKPRSLWQDAWTRLRGNKMALLSIVILILIVLSSIFAPMFSPFEYEGIDYNYMGAPPSLESGHWFGTDEIGRDIFTRVFVGARISLMVGLVATLVSLIIGVTYGATAGFFGGRLDNFMMRFVDVMYSLPFLFFVIILMVVFGRNIFLIFVAIGAVEWLTMARIVRGQTLSLRNREFIEASFAAGMSRFQIIRKHIIPNVLGPVIVYGTLTVPLVILAESFLSFLGLGVQEPMTSWGVLISEGSRQMEAYPWTLIFPSIFLSLTLFSFNFLGDGLRDAFDPKDR